MPRFPLPGAIAALALFAAPAWAADPPGTVDFARDVLPVLSDNCFRCHGPDEKARKGDLRLDTKDGLLAAKGDLLPRVTSKDPDEVMPPPKSNKKLTAAQIDVLTRWVEQGAKWGTHWAFTPPKRPAVPVSREPKASAWVKNPIDAFILARLDREKLKPSPEASKEAIIRRVTLDLTGVPPTLDEIDAFLKDKSLDAYEKVVDRLLASPRFGERMAWDWLDAARYADSNGYQGDSERTMWPWRDWVVKAFNDDLPYDQFTTWQLAGDLLPNATKEQVLATGFNRNHMINGEGGRISEENRIEYTFDQTETMGTIWLGLTLTCSRCHDHKYDPLTRKDYYQLTAFFNQTPVDGVGRGGQAPPVLDFAQPEQDAKLKLAQKSYDDIVKKVAGIETKLRDAAAVLKDGKYETTLPVVVESALRKGPNGRVDANTDELVKFFEKKEPEYVKLLGELKKFKQARDAIANSVPRVMVMQDMPKPRDTFILTRGAYDKHEDKVLPGVPAVFQADGQPSVGVGQNRLALAKWLVAAENPLTARVTVNRVWQMLLGAGLVKTTEDFGVQGERPIHPELLDWLACEFVESTGRAEDRKVPGTWSMKRLVRLIVTSAAYRQSSKGTAELYERDPDNRLLARGPRHRLPSWMIRDQALFASGLMTPTLGGPPVKTYQPDGVWEEATFGSKRYQQDKGEALYRRSLYVFWRRIIGPTVFFDSANRQTCTVKTTVTNSPLHALSTLNDVTYVEAARTLAQKAMESKESDADRLAFAFRRVTSRMPTAQEAKLLAGALATQRTLFDSDKPAAGRLIKVGDSPRNPKLDPTEHAALTAVCTLILNLDETLTKQ